MSKGVFIYSFNRNWHITWSWWGFVVGFDTEFSVWELYLGFVNITWLRP